MTYKKVDENQKAIVKALRAIPGVTVEPGHDDLLIGHKNRNYWVEVKRPEAMSKRTGEVMPSELTDTERHRQEHWKGQYLITDSLDRILEEINAVSG